MKKEIHFTEQERLKHLDIADLLEDGDFWCDFVVGDFENGKSNYFSAVGILERPDGKTEQETIEVNTVEEFDINDTAGQIFNLEWDEWQI